jgi:hypothetical protein
MLATAVLLGCSSIDCPVQNTVRTVYELSEALNDTLTVTTQRSVSAVPSGATRDTILLNSGTALTTFSLPISYTNPVDTLIFKTVRLVAVDTVWIEKEDIPHFESVDCGASFFHRITSVRSTHVGIDSIVLKKAFVDYDKSTAHIFVYFKARP